MGCLFLLMPLANMHLLVFVTHLLSKFSVLMFGNLFSPLFYNRTHPELLPYYNKIYIPKSLCGVNPYFKFT